MKNKEIVKKLSIISIVILIIGAILGFGVRNIMLKSITEQNLPNENIAGIGADYSIIIDFLGNVFTAYIGIGIFIISIIIDLIIWIGYGIYKFNARRKK